MLNASFHDPLVAPVLSQLLRNMVWPHDILYRSVVSSMLQLLSVMCHAHGKGDSRVFSQLGWWQSTTSRQSIKEQLSHVYHPWQWLALVCFLVQPMSIGSLEPTLTPSSPNRWSTLEEERIAQLHWYCIALVIFLSTYSQHLRKDSACFTPICTCSWSWERLLYASIPFAAACTIEQFTIPLTALKECMYLATLAPSSSLSRSSQPRLAWGKVATSSYGHPQILAISIKMLILLTSLACLFSKLLKKLMWVRQHCLISMTL